MAHDGPIETGTPAPVGLSYRPIITLGSVGWVRATSATSDSPTSYAAAAGGAAVSHDINNDTVLTAKAHSLADEYFYAQVLYVVPLSQVWLDNYSQIMRPDPPDSSTAFLDPRCFDYTWDVLTLAAVKWVPYGLVAVAEVNVSDTDLAAVVAHGFAFSYWSGAVDLSTPSRPTVPWQAAGALPAADWTWAPVPADFTVFSSPSSNYTASWFHPDPASDGVAIPTADFNAGNGVADVNAYVFAYPLWQAISDGPPANESYSLVNQVNTTDPVGALLLTYDPASTYHYSFYDGPTSPAPISYDLGTATASWSAATTDQGVLDHYLVEVVEVPGGTVALSYTVSAGVTSSGTGFTPVSGTTYRIRITAYDSVGPGPSAESPVFPGPNGDPKIDLTGSMLAQFRAGVTVLGVVSTDPAPL